MDRATPLDNASNLRFLFKRDESEAGVILLAKSNQASRVGGDFSVPYTFCEDHRHGGAISCPSNTPCLGNPIRCSHARGQRKGSIRAHGLSPVSPKLRSLDTSGTQTVTRFAPGLLWREPPSKRFRKLPDTRRSQCPPVTAIYLQRTNFPWVSESQERPPNSHLRADAVEAKKPTATRTATKQNCLSLSKGHFACKSLRILVPGGGVEPPRGCPRRILSPLRLPVPPSRRIFDFTAHLRRREAPLPCIRHPRQYAAHQIAQRKHQQ